MVLGLGLVFAGGVVCGEASLSGLMYLWWVGGAVLAPGALLVLGSGALSGERGPVEEPVGSTVEGRSAGEQGSGGWRLGELLVEFGFISEPQLATALERQEGSHRRLGEILVEMGLITPAWLAQVLKEQAVWSGSWRAGA
jgi:hypothetical protein